MSRQECLETMEPVKNTLVEVKNALVGKDLRSGLVQQVINLDNKVSNLITQFEEQKAQDKEKTKKKDQENFRLKLATVSFGFTLFGFLVEFAFNHFIH